MIVVIEPGQRSVQTAETVRRLAEDLKIPRVGIVVNKAPRGGNLDQLTARLEGLPLLGRLSHDPEIALADIEGRSPYTGSEAQKAEVRAIIEAVERLAGPVEG
mgnify:CR=1 FL=1